MDENRNLEIEIIEENDEFLVVNKPYGLVVNRSESQKDFTLQDWLEKRYKFSSNLNLGLDIESEFLNRSGIVHRLDKETSGVMLCAKNEKSFIFYQNKFKTREVSKKYIAITQNKVLDERFEIDAPIKRDPRNRFKYAVVRDGKEAQTYFEKIKDFEIDNHEFSVIYCYPRTGRTHQIRVHLSANLTPVAGDLIYSTNSELEISKNLGFNRLMLHSFELKFLGPSNEDYIFKSDPQEIFSKYL
jgi:23S rRNA pseudouridine1911/1915/1917 synthase